MSDFKSSINPALTGAMFLAAAEFVQNYTVPKQFDNGLTPVDMASKALTAAFHDAGAKDEKIDQSIQAAKAIIGTRSVLDLEGNIDRMASFASEVAKGLTGSGISDKTIIDTITQTLGAKTVYDAIDPNTVDPYLRVTLRHGIINPPLPPYVLPIETKLELGRSSSAPLVLSLH